MLDVLATWNDSVIFAGRLPEPIRPRDVMKGAEGDFERAEDGTLVFGDLRVTVAGRSDVADFKPKRRMRAAFTVLAASFALHALVLGVSRATPVDPAKELAERRSLIAHLLSVHAEAPEETAVASETEGGTGSRAKAEEGAMGRASKSAPVANWGTPGNKFAEAAEFGMIGIIGTGEGGGGRGEGIGLGTLGHGSGTGTGFGYGHGRLGGAHVSDALPSQGPSGVRAGEWDDNASLREFRKVLGASREPYQSLDVSVRRVIVARDSAGKALPSCSVFASDAQGTTVALRTLSSGRALLFPRAEGLVGNVITASMRCGGNAATQTFSLANGDDGLVTLDGHEPRDAPGPLIDVGFALDTTGSMGEEIAAVQSTLRLVASHVSNVRVGLVEYKDRSDPYVTRVFPMSTNLPHFASTVSMLNASGGGDEPEAVNVGLHEAISSLAWSPDAPARLLFVIGDAPPHVQDPGPRYADEARAAAHAGIQIFTIAASGMNAFGQIVFRQIAQYTGGTEMFVLRGGAGPQSVGGGDPMKSCGGTQTRYTSGNLDGLIVAKIDSARAALDENAADMRGIGQDATPTVCRP